MANAHARLPRSGIAPSAPGPLGALDLTWSKAADVSGTPRDTERTTHRVNTSAAQADPLRRMRLQRRLRPVPRILAHQEPTLAAVTRPCSSVKGYLSLLNRHFRFQVDPVSAIDHPSVPRVRGRPESLLTRLARQKRFEVSPTQGKVLAARSTIRQLLETMLLSEDIEGTKRSEKDLIC